MKAMRSFALSSALVLAALGSPGASVGAPASIPCPQCVKIRVGVPIVTRGPSPGIPDSQFTAIQLPDGRYRGFSASGTTYAIDGAKPWDMGGTARPVLPPGPKGAYGESGEWINHAERSGERLLAWVHDETGDRPGQGLKSMSLASSTDNGLSWRRLGQIISGTDPLIQGKVTGEGDCSAVNGGDGYYYAYCGRARDHATVAARSPIADPSPGRWAKWFNGAWSQPGIGGNSTPIPTKTAGLARWTTTGQILALGVVPGGIGLFVSSDHVTFEPLPEPLLPNGPGSWARPDPEEFSSYFGIMDVATGANQVGDKWMLSYAYIQPGESFGQRYLVFRPIDVWISATPVHPQVGVMLARWYNPARQARWSTISAVPPAAGYRFESQAGYLMTTADPATASIALDECVQQQAQGPDYVLTRKGQCERRGYRRLRAAGFVYVAEQAGAQPIYQCAEPTSRSHFVSNQNDCEGHGRSEGLLGYDLTH